MWGGVACGELWTCIRLEFDSGLGPSWSESGSMPLVHSLYAASYFSLNTSTASKLRTAWYTRPLMTSRKAV